MNLVIGAIGLFLIAERVGKYLLILYFFQRGNVAIERDRLSAKIDRASILQPILSGDPTLWHCLESNLRMRSDYPIEFVWIIDDDDTEAHTNTRQLIDRYSQVSVKLISLPNAPELVSPKTFKLIAGLQQATGTIITVLDDDTILPDFGLDRAISALDRPQIGVAFGLPYYLNFTNLWSTLVSCAVNSSSLLTYIPYTFVTEPFTINGMFFVMKRDVLESVGGFSAIEGAIVDDFAIARHFRSHGYKLAQSPVCHGISTQIRDLSHYFKRLNRWFIFPQESILKGVTVRELAIFYLTAFLPTIIPLIIVIYCLLFPSMSALLYAVAYFGINLYILSQFNSQYFNNATPGDRLFLLLIIQLIMPFHIILALLSPRQIDWRGNIIKLKPDGSFESVKRRRSVED